MFEGEFTHRGDRCTFEVLLARGRPRRSGAGRDRRDHPRHRPEGRQVRPRRSGRHPQPDRGHRLVAQRRRPAPGARRRRSRRSLPVFCQQAAHQMNKQMTDHGVPFGEAMKVWARVAALSFGGPAGQIAVMHRIIVEEKKWIGENRFLQALNYCTLLPGPEAQQLAIYIGWLMHKTKGGLFAGTLFVLPGLIAIMALSWIYVLLGKLTIVAGPVLRAEGRRAGRSWSRRCCASASARSRTTSWWRWRRCRSSPSSSTTCRSPIIVFGAGLIGYVAGRAGLEPVPGRRRARQGRRQAGRRPRFAARRGDARRMPGPICAGRSPSPRSSSRYGWCPWPRSISPWAATTSSPRSRSSSARWPSSPSAAPMPCWPMSPSRRSSTITG